MNRLLSVHVSALTLVLLAGTFARAGNMPPSPIQWTYNFSPNFPPGALYVPADGNPGAGVTFTNEPTKNATNSSDVVASNLKVFSAASAGSPDNLMPNGSTYKLTLTLSTTDSTGAHTGSLTFSGKLFGSFSAQNSNVSNTFLTLTPQTLTLGSVKFVVELKSFTPPGPPDQANYGSISAHVTVSSPVVTKTPEPSTMVLSSLGLTFLSGAAWRKRRRVRARS